MSTEDKRRRRKFLEDHAIIFEWLVAKKGVPVGTWERANEADHTYEASRRWNLYAPTTARCDVLSGLRGLAVRMAAEKEANQAAATEEARAQMADHLSSRVILLLTGDGIDRTEILRRVKAHFRKQ